MKSLKLKSIVTLAIAMFVFCNNTFAQDKIYKKSKTDPIEAQVIEIGTSEIKYKLMGEESEGLVYVTEKESIQKIEFENGRVEEFGKSKIDMTEYFAGQKTKAMKVSFLGPLIGVTKFSYEQNIKPGRSWDVKATIVGLGVNESMNNTRGFFGSVGYKFFKNPTYVTSNLRRKHIMQGAYLKPEIFFGGYKTSYGERETVNNGGGGFILNLGKQWVFGEMIVLDIAAGLGYGSGESGHGYLIGDNVAGSGTLSLGILF